MSETSAAPRTRNPLQHWLPSQGIDPAPLTELNADCLGMLTARAAENQASAAALPLLGALARPLELLSASAARRLANAPFALFDAGLAQAPRWLTLRAPGVQDGGDAPGGACFPPPAARLITHRLFVYAWHLARSRPRAARLVFGLDARATDALAVCSLSTLELATERHQAFLKPRWPHDVEYWRSLLNAANNGDEARLHELLLGGVQRIAAEVLPRS
jgi:hypothetical protein